MIHWPARSATLLLMGLTLPALGLPTMLAAQEAQSFDLNGHKVTLGDTDDFTRALSIDGKEIFNEEQVFLDDPLQIAGQTVLTGTAGAGGNACNAAPFVLSLENGQPRVDGPIESCSYLERSTQGDAILFSTTPLPGVPSEVWRWTAADGLKQAPGVDFTPIANQGWDSFASLAGKHPIEALGFAPVYAQIHDGLSPVDFAAYANILSEIGSGDLVPFGYRGETCDKLVCDQVWAYLWIDKDSKQAFAAWQASEDTAPHVFPSDSSKWPKWVQSEAEEVVFGGE